MTDRFQTLVRITQFGAVKVVPGLVNILMIPFLHTAMGAAAFGRFSLFLSYALLAVTVLGAVVTQPMFRFLSSDRESLSRFYAFALLAGAAGALAGALAVIIIAGNAAQSLIGAVFVLSAILYTAVIVRYQIEGEIRRLVLLEAARVAILCGVILILSLQPGPVAFAHVTSAFMLSYLLPLLASARDLRLEWPDRKWLLSRIGFGFRSATWLILAGLPFVLSKTLLATHVSDLELGAYSANADMFYRIFGMVNIAIAMWAFPTMSAAFDSGNLREARRTLWFGTTVYALASLTITAAAVFGALFTGPFPAPLSGGLQPYILLLVACFLWQGMSLAHKPLELAQMTGRMIWLMVAAFLLFGATMWVLLTASTIDPVSAAAIALIVSSVSYSVGALVNKTVKSKFYGY